MFGSNRRKFLQECLSIVQTADYINAQAFLAMTDLTDNKFPRDYIDEVMARVPDLARRTDNLIPPTERYALLNIRIHDWVKNTILCTNILVEAAVLQQEGKSVDSKMQEFLNARSLVDGVHNELMAIFDRGIV